MRRRGGRSTQQYVSYYPAVEKLIYQVFEEYTDEGNSNRFTFSQLVGWVQRRRPEIKVERIKLVLQSLYEAGIADLDPSVVYEPDQLDQLMHGDFF